MTLPDPVVRPCANPAVTLTGSRNGGVDQQIRGWATLDPAQTLSILQTPGGTR
jgi:hypothetical protein